jgi:ribosomal protein S18 acetylase RimI-like enzyme
MSHLPYTVEMLETRAATVADAALITAHRHAMFSAMGSGTPKSLEEMSRHFEPWLQTRLADGRYLGWLTLDGDRPIASTGLLLMDWPPHALHPDSAERGYILNLFVEPEYRRRGLARTLVELCLAEARRRDIAVVTLHASAEGRPLYEALGFSAANEMQFIDRTL